MGRLILGFAVALSAVGDCVYISEIAPPVNKIFIYFEFQLISEMRYIVNYIVNI